MKRLTAQLVLVAVLVTGLLLQVAPVSSQPVVGVIDRAKQAYAARSYGQVVKLLHPMLYPRSRIASETDEASAYKLLGLAYWWQSQLAQDPQRKRRLLDMAEQQFGALLSLDPKHRLSRLVHSNQLVTFFEEVRKKHSIRTSPREAMETELKHCRRDLAATKQRFNRYRETHRSRIELTRTVEKRYYFWNFIPFGAGQFQNEQPVKGGLFAGGQGALLLTSLSLFILAESPYIRKDWGGKIRTNDIEARQRAYAIQVAQITTGTMFWALVAWGIIDAVIHYKRTKTSLERRDVPLEGSSLELTPGLGPGGLGLSGRF